MSYAERHVVAITTAADGSATAYTPVITGKIVNVIYDKTDFADGIDFTVTAEATGQTIWSELNVNASKTVAPRQATHSTAGVASVYAGAGEAVLDDIVVANDRVKIVVASGGNAKTGAITVVVA